MDSAERRNDRGVLADRERKRGKRKKREEEADWGGKKRGAKKGEKTEAKETQ